MNKQDTLDSLEKARRNLEFNLQTIKSMILGKEVASIPNTDRHDCLFGRWLVDPETNIKGLLGPFFFKDLDTLHIQWSEDYGKVYALLFEEPYYSKDNPKKKVGAMEIDKCKLYYKDIEETTAKLVNSLASCKRRLVALPDEKFKS